MTFTPWELAELVCKVLLYAGLAGAAGTGLMLVFHYDGSRRLLRFLLLYGLITAVLGFHGVVGNFLVQVGLINGSGLAGMFDWTMASILLDTEQGDSTLLRLAGFALIIITLLIALARSQALQQAPGLRYRLWTARPLFIAMLLIAISFRMIGHVSVHGVLAQLAITLHVLAMTLWVGALLPLWLLCRWQAGNDLALVMRRFGDQALVIVAVLVVAGVGLLFALLASPLELLTTRYGQALLLKLVLVMALLGLAALNRFRLVPQLLTGSAGSVAALQRSIRLEIVAASLILLLTAFLSTLVGPMDAAMA